MNISNLTSCCVNPYTRSVTSNIKNTYVPEGVELDFMFDKLRPIDDVVAGLKEPLKLADEFYVNKSSNELYISKGTTITVEGGFVFTVLEKGVTAGYGDINIPTPRDTDDQELRQAAQDMAGALSRLLRDASGITNVTQSESYPKWNQDICKLLEHLGIDTSKDFSVNGVKYTRNEKGYFESEHSIASKEAYEILKNNNRSYTLADESTKNRVHSMSDYYLASAPEEVCAAWQETLEETGINPFQAGYGSSLQQLATEQDFATGGNDQIFGESIESSIEAIDKILERIANPKTSEDEDYVSNMVDPEQEIEFYTTLRNKLTGESETNMDSEEILHSHIEEMQANIEAGNVDNESVIQVGGKAYTQEEWEKLLEYVDEVEAETQEAMEVEQVMKEAAEETGYNETEQMDYLSQAFIKKVENLVNGVDNPSDIFGSTVESALQAAQELLYELENPLTPAGVRGENAEMYMEQEKEFYRALIEKLETVSLV